MRKVQERRMKGITLIALVITIVILLILAGITISALSGENGILKRAAEAKEQNVRGVEEEAISIAYTGVLTKNNMEAVTSGTAVQGVTAGDLEEELHKNGHEDATATGTGTITVTFSNSGNSYTVDANTGKVGEIRVSDESDSDEVSKILSPFLNSDTGVALLENGKVVKITTNENSICDWTGLQIGEELSEINGAKKSFGDSYNYYIIDNSGFLWSWGLNDCGQLGIGSTEGYVKIPNKIEGLSEITDVYDGGGYAIAKDISGNLWSWGLNNCGQLGIGSTEEYVATPQQINGLSGITDVYTDGYSVIVKNSSGNLWSWGSNSDGRLGIGSTEECVTIPNKIEGLSGITDVYFGGGVFIIAKDTNGNLWSWGSNDEGQLGIGSTEEYVAIPNKIEGLSGVTNVYTNENTYYTIAKDSSGNLWSWGSNYNGRLGIGSTEGYVKIPNKIEGLSGIADVYIGGSGNVIAKNNSGNLWSWGYNYNGILGIGSTEEYVTTPQQINGLSGITDVYTNYNYYVIAKDSSGNLWSWGENYNGQLGIGSTENKISPQKINGLSGITDVYMEDAWVIAKDRNGNVWTWGSNELGRLSIETESNLCTTPIKLNDNENIAFYGKNIEELYVKDEQITAPIYNYIVKTSEGEWYSYRFYNQAV